MPVSIRKVKNGNRYFYRFMYDGKRYNSKAIYKSKAEASKSEREHLNRLDEEARKPKTELLIKDLMNDHLDQVKLNQSKAHYQETRRYYRMLLERIGNIPVQNVKKIDILKLLNSFSAQLIKDGKSNWNVNSMLSILKHLFYTAINDHEIEMKNPCLNIKRFPIENHLKLIPTNEMIEAVLLECDEEERLLICFVMETGARINECLRFSSKDISNGQIVLYTRKSRYSNLTGRKIPMPSCIIGINFDGRLFKRWTHYPRFLENKIRKLGLPMFGFHNLRHRYASRLSAKGTPIYQIMELLGHSQISTTQIYLQSFF